MGVVMPTGLAHPKYRSDIDGLRAVAVLSVLAFHAFPKALPGGFIGVDIFFVISGYLISTIIISSLEKNNFSLLDFYRRRIKRIFPGLLLTLGVVVGAGWVMLFSAEFQKLGKHVGGSAGFVSNFLLEKESGYFDVSAETKPLLHLWSLAIEEQFYLIWPLLLMVSHRLRLNVLPVTVILGTFSFFVNLYFSFYNASKGFYWPFGRFWELLVGALAAILLLKQPVIERRWKDSLSIVGGTLLLIGLVFFNKKTLFPGFSALIPTAGAFLIILAGSRASVPRGYPAG
jgi:peptidoglycan/LPS O-acetylase OafA/YrhL